MKKNNKTVQIFLGIALLGIWGTIIYRIVDAMNGDELVLTNPYTLPIDTTSTKAEQAFKLRLDYGDPFKATVTAQSFNASEMSNNENAVSSSITAPPPVAIPPKPKKKVNFPTITYHGMVKNNSTGVKIAILKILNQSRRIKNGDDFNGVRVLQTERDSVRIYFKGETRTFKRQ